MPKLRPGYIRVSSGGLTRWIKAKTPEAAFNKFLKLYKPKKLGLLVEYYGSCIDDPDHIAYASTQNLLMKIGRWSGEVIDETK